MIDCMNVTDVIKQADPKREFISIEKGDVNLVMVFDHDALVNKNERKTVRVYKLDEDGETVKPVNVKMVIDKIVSAIEDDIDVKELLEEVMKNTPPDLLLKIYTGLLEEGVDDIDIGSAPAYHCCYSILTKFKDGSTIEIPISGGRYDRHG